jgi:tetratricopeptide (TPR) repeat protein
MKLRSSFCPQQLLFLGFIAVVLAGQARAQAPQQAVVKLKTGATQQGVINQVSASGVSLQLSPNQSVTFALNLIDSVQMQPPPEYNVALQEINKRDLTKAASLVNAVVSKYKGLPTEWAQHATALVGDLALQAGDLKKATAAYEEFKKFYPSAKQSEIGLAAIAASKKDFATAKEKITPIIEEALKVKDVPITQRYAYSRAFYVSAQVKESEGNLAGALEDYLRTVTIFYHDAAAVAAAQERADALRKQKIAVP